MPDLVSDPPGDRGVQIDSSGDVSRLLLRLDGFIHNAGRGPVELLAGGRVGQTMTAVEQHVFDERGGLSTLSLPNARVIYETSDGHRHWHLQAAVRYSLWNYARGALVVDAPKVGFCLQDSEPRDPHAPASVYYEPGRHGHTWCEHDEPETNDPVLMGISPGWSDDYPSYLPFQWVDVSYAAPGRYWLRSDVDPDDAIREADEANAPGWVAHPSIVPGYLAQSVNAGSVSVGAPTLVTLAARRFGLPDDSRRRFEIVEPPRHGSLSPPVGERFAGPWVTYTPDPGFTGTDSFRFVARDAQSDFPASPPAATAVLAVGVAPLTVAISGAPAEIPTGQGVQLSALTSDGSPVTWSVEGTPGGGPLVGTISQSGFYAAPAAVPPDGAVLVRAESASGAFDEVTLRIVPAPPAEPAPSVPGPRPVRALLSRPRVVRRGRLLLVGVTAARAGRISVVARRGRRRIGSCSVRAPAGRRVVCRIRLRSRRPRGVRVTVTLRARGRVVAVRRARL
jgi:hypothetical protein